MNTKKGKIFERSDYLIFILCAATIIVAAVTHFSGSSAILAFICAAVAVAFLAALVGRCVEQLGTRLGPGAIGVLQAGLGNLPELFISLFALRAGLLEVVRAAIIGSILANLLLLLGLCFLIGGLRNGTQQLGSSRSKAITVFMVLTVAALVLPSVASYIHAPASTHEETLSTITAIIRLALFILTLPASLKRRNPPLSPNKQSPHEKARWPLGVSLALLGLGAVGAAFVSEWLVNALEPAMRALHVSNAFAGLVIIAVAGNAIENVVGLQLAIRNQSKYAFSVVINSPLQVALVLAPVLVILSEVLGYTPLTLVFSPMLVVSVSIAVIMIAFITFDGESNWIEGAALIAVYAIIASSFWWG
jgi:Ca2+:H+ antiporter